MGRTALLAGATGLVGGHLLRLLLDDAAIAGVVALTRRHLRIPHPKLDEARIDFAQITEFALPPVDDYFCCLGTTIRAAGSRQAFREVDLVYPVTIANMALAAGATHCIFVSALGADADSPVFYLRTKGEAERELASLPFRTVVALRPSLLAGRRPGFRAGERLALLASRAFAPLLPARWCPIDATTVARAMLACAGHGDGRFVVESDEIGRIAAQAARGDA